ncbi:MAG: TylF/MycF/NovP-related O-methyltransferase [Desulfofustis sp.]
MNEHEKRYDIRKLKKIARYAKKYGVRSADSYRFQSDTPESDYLDSLKRRILKEQVSMLGEHKLDTLRYCVEDCLTRGVAGDIIETGVWKGGATIYLAGILKAHGDASRRVLVADSFEGLPRPDVKKWPRDKGGKHYKREDLAISLEEVRANFKRFNLLSDKVIFVKGFFEDSLQNVNIEKLSVLRLDGDMYGSTMTVLMQLYHKLEVGGYLILDDWLLAGAREALLDFRRKVGIREELYQDYSGVFWKKSMTTRQLSE